MAGMVSAVSWFDSQPHLRVYKGNGSQVTEEAYDGHWYKGGFSEPGTTVGATSWMEGGQIHIRVYVGTGTNKAIKEYCWDKDKWYEGAFASQTGATGDGASATSWLQGSQIHIRVYVRDNSNKVTEWCWDGQKWYKGGYPG